MNIESRLRKTDNTLNYSATVALEIVWKFQGYTRMTDYNKSCVVTLSIETRSKIVTACKLVY